MTVLQWLVILANSRFSLLQVILPGMSWCKKFFHIQIISLGRIPRSRIIRSKGLNLFLAHGTYCQPAFHMYGNGSPSCRQPMTKAASLHLLKR